jgi:hypothetical protein
VEPEACANRFEDIGLQGSGMPVDGWRYDDELAEFSGRDVPRVSAWRRELYQLLAAEVHTRAEEYRDAPSAAELACYSEAEREFADIFERHRRTGTWSLVDDAHHYLWK